MTHAAFIWLAGLRNRSRDVTSVDDVIDHERVVCHGMSTLVVYLSNSSPSRLLPLCKILSSSTKHQSKVQLLPFHPNINQPSTIMSDNSNSSTLGSYVNAATGAAQRAYGAVTGDSSYQVNPTPSITIRPSPKLTTPEQGRSNPNPSRSPTRCLPHHRQAGPHLRRPQHRRNRQR